MRLETPKIGGYKGIKNRLKNRGIFWGKIGKKGGFYR